MNNISKFENRPKNDITNLKLSAKPQNPEKSKNTLNFNQKKFLITRKYDQNTLLYINLILNNKSIFLTKDEIDFLQNLDQNIKTLSTKFNRNSTKIGKNEHSQYNQIFTQKTKSFFEKYLFSQNHFSKKSQILEKDDSRFCDKKILFPLFALLRLLSTFDQSISKFLFTDNNLEFVFAVCSLQEMTPAIKTTAFSALCSLFAHEDALWISVFRNGKKRDLLLDIALTGLSGNFGELEGISASALLLNFVMASSDERLASEFGLLEIGDELRVRTVSAVFSGINRKNQVEIS
ncbi:hypothetical protein MHBO_003829, partial [Bonamia ostreae]